MLRTPLTSQNDRIRREQYSEPPKPLYPSGEGFDKLLVGLKRDTYEVIVIRTVAKEIVRHGRQKKRPDLEVLDAVQCFVKGSRVLDTHENHFKDVEVWQNRQVSSKCPKYRLRPIICQVHRHHPSHAKPAGKYQVLEPCETYHM